MDCPEPLIDKLEASFRRFQQQRLANLPIVNPRLKVQAVGFRAWQGHCLGVLVTPWFMNLMLLPQTGGEWRERPPGSKVLHRFPSGSYEFIAGEEEGIGAYQMCSLFSPMSEFDSQALAVAIAEKVMQELMQEAGHAGDGAREGEPPGAGAGKSPERREQRPMSRRALLRGLLLRGEE